MKKTLALLLVLLMLSASGCGKKQEVTKKEETNKPVEYEEVTEIPDNEFCKMMAKDTRPVAVMIDNDSDVPKLKYVYDLADTGTRQNSRPVNLWRMEQELGIPFYRGAAQMMDYYLRSGEEEEAAKCFETYVENMLHAEECFKESVFFSDLGEDIRFISNGTLVSLEVFREELVQVMQNPGYMKRLCDNEKVKQSMEKLRAYMEGK